MRRQAICAALLAAAVAAPSSGCGGGDGTPVPAGPPSAAVALLEPTVGPAAEAVADAVGQLADRCPDLRTDRAAAAATLEVGASLRLRRGDARWAAVPARLVQGLAGLEPGAACRPALTLWVGTATLPTTIPTTPPSTTTVPVDVQVARIEADGAAPPAAPADFRRIRMGQTLSEVRRILGSRGVRIGEEVVGRHRDELVRWPARGRLFASIRVQFRDRRVVAATTTGDR